MDVIHPTDSDEVYGYQMFYSAKTDTGGVTTLTKESVDFEHRVRIDRHRGRILEAMSEVPRLVDYYIGEPSEELQFITLEEVMN